jgi:hypothetical protein
MGRITESSKGETMNCALQPEVIYHKPEIFVLVTWNHALNERLEKAGWVVIQNLFNKSWLCTLGIDCADAALNASRTELLPIQKVLDF